MQNTTTTKRSMKTYLCLICGVVYDEIKNCTERVLSLGHYGKMFLTLGLAYCGATKQDFDMVAVGAYA